MLVFRQLCWKNCTLCIASLLFSFLSFFVLTNLQKKLFITHSIPVYAVSTLFDSGRQPSSCSPVLVFAKRTACMLCHVHCTVYVSNRNVLKTSFPHKSRKTFQFLYLYTVCTLIGCTLYIQLQVIPYNVHSIPSISIL